MITSLDVVPFPAGPPDNLFCLDSNMCFQDQMRHCKIMLLRCHPDNFFANFQSQIPADDGVLLQGLKKKLSEVTQTAMNVRKDLRPMEQD